MSIELSLSETLSKIKGETVGPSRKTFLHQKKPDHVTKPGLIPSRLKLDIRFLNKNRKKTTLCLYNKSTTDKTKGRCDRLNLSLISRGLYLGFYK